MSLYRKMLWQLAIVASGRGARNQYTRLLNQWQWLDRESTERLQRERLARLLSYAYEHVPYYRTLLADAGVARGGLIDIDRFTEVPLLERESLRRNFDRLQSRVPPTSKRYRNSSGGSTGEPVRFVQDEDYRNWATAAKALKESWVGYSVGSRRAILWGSERDLFVGCETPRTRFVRWLKNELWLNAFRMTSDQMREHIRRFNDFAPETVLAYAESIYELARFAEQRGIVMHSPRLITSAAGTLHPHMRETVSRVFHAPVFDGYGSREASCIASECEQHEGLHVFSPHMYVELLRRDGSPVGPAEVGEVVVTVLTNYSMPLIRYRIGDLAKWAAAPCSCGRGWPLLQSITGRVTDVFLRRNGGVVVPEYLIHLVGVVLNTGWIRKYQMIQEDYETVRVIIALHNPTVNPEEKYSTEFRQIEEKVKLVMGDDCRVLIDVVSDIPASASGKYRYTISLVEACDQSPCILHGDSR